MRDLYISLMLGDGYDYDFKTNKIVPVKVWGMEYSRYPDYMDDFYDEGTPGTYGDDVMKAIHATIGPEDAEGYITLKNTPYDPAKIGKAQAIQKLTADLKKHNVNVINRRTDIPENQER